MSLLRIQGGEFRGRRLKGPPRGMYVRPILARIKKSLFDILQFRLGGSRFLDLYAGTGSVGIEALSRGAASVTFVESDRRCISVIEANISMLRSEDRAQVVRGDARQGFRGDGLPFDIIFTGPPYRDDARRMLAYTGPTLTMIAARGLLAPGGIIAAQHHQKESIPDIPELDQVREERYGDSIISFYKESKIKNQNYRSKIKNERQKKKQQD